MSRGDLSHYDEQVDPSYIAELVRLERKHKQFADFEDGEFRFNHREDIPWVAGRSRDCSIIYIDRHSAYMRELKLINGTTAQRPVSRFLLVHETKEWWLMTNLDYQYERAHHIATAAEQRAVRAAGIDWKSYGKSFEKDIKRDNDPRIQRVPRNLDLRPYTEGGASKHLMSKIYAAQASRRGLRDLIPSAK